MKYVKNCKQSEETLTISNLRTGDVFKVKTSGFLYMKVSPSQSVCLVTKTCHLFGVNRRAGVLYNNTPNQEVTHLKNATLCGMEDQERERENNC